MTLQIEEILTYKDVEYEMRVRPLDSYLKKHNIEFKAWCTACWRGYMGHWVIEENKLYLTKLSAFISTEEDSRWGNECVGIKYLFPNQDKVFADWFSGEIPIPYGEKLDSVQKGYISLYKQEMLLEIMNGKLVSSNIIKMTRTHRYQD